MVAAGWGAAESVIGEQHSFTNGRIIVAGGKVRRGKQRRGMTVPVPPLVVQDRIVQTLELLVQKTQRLEVHLEEADKASSALFLSLHHKIAAGRTVRLSEAIELHEIAEPITPAGTYPQVQPGRACGWAWRRSALL